MRRGRPVDPVFEADELLYYRFLPKHFIEGRLRGEAVRFPDYSVNRGKHSEPADVLFPNWFFWGVASFRVSDATLMMRNEADVTFEFQIAHKPLDENYAHAEVRAYRDGTYHPQLNVSNKVKREYRERIVQAARREGLLPPRSAESERMER